MAYEHDVLAEIDYLPTSVGAAYTIPGSGVAKAFVRMISLHNKKANTQAENVYVYKKLSAGSDIEIYSVLLQPGQTLDIEVAGQGRILKNVGDAIRWVTDSASMVSGEIYGGTQ